MIVVDILFSCAKGISMEKVKNLLVFTMLILMTLISLDAAQKKIAQKEWGKSGLSLTTSKQEPSRKYELKAAGVLPIKYDPDRNKITAILGRQSIINGINAGKYDYFAGLAEKKDNGDSVAVAAREWVEESLLGALHYGEEQARQLIRKHVKGYIIIGTHWKNDKNTYGVMYLVDISQESIFSELFDKFEPNYHNFLQEKENGTKGLSAFLEKDRLVEVKLNDLLNSVHPNAKKKLTPIRCSGEGVPSDETIELRDIVALLLRGITKQNELIFVHNNFPLGVFVFGSRETAKNRFELFDIPPVEKTMLNQFVQNNLLLQNEIGTSAQQPNIAALVREAMEHRAKKKDTEKISQRIIDQTPLQDVPVTVPRVQPDQGISAKRAAAVREEDQRQTRKQTQEIAEQLPQEFIIPEQNSKTEQRNAGALNYVTRTISSAFTTLTNLIDSILNWIGSAYHL
jgi:hypothetical protein